MLSGSDLTVIFGQLTEEYRSARRERSLRLRRLAVTVKEATRLRDDVPLIKFSRMPSRTPAVSRILTGIGIAPSGRRRHRADERRQLERGGWEQQVGLVAVAHGLRVRSWLGVSNPLLLRPPAASFRMSSSLISTVSASRFLFAGLLIYAVRHFRVRHKRDPRTPIQGSQAEAMRR